MDVAFDAAPFCDLRGQDAAARRRQLTQALLELGRQPGVAHRQRALTCHCRQELLVGGGQVGPVGRHDYVISADEKTSIQARVRTHPTQPPAAGRPTRVEHEYDRGGALAYLAAWDVGRAKIFGRCEATTGIDPFMRLVDDVMTTQPYASARRVFWIVDNGSSHRGAAAVTPLRDTHNNAHLVHLPIHASRLTRSRSTSRSFNAKS